MSHLGDEHNLTVWTIKHRMYYTDRMHTGNCCQINCASGHLVMVWITTDNEANYAMIMKRLGSDYDSPTYILFIITNSQYNPMDFRVFHFCYFMYTSLKLPTHAEIWLSYSTITMAVMCIIWISVCVFFAVNFRHTNAITLCPPIGCYHPYLINC